MVFARGRTTCFSEAKGSFLFGLLRMKFRLTLLESRRISSMKTTMTKPTIEPSVMPIIAPRGSPLSSGATKGPLVGPRRRFRLVDDAA